MKVFESGSIGEWNGEEWVYFHWAADIIGDTLAIPPGPAQAQLRKLCASGEVRAIISDKDYMEQPEPIPASRWREVDVDLTAPYGWIDVAVSRADFDYWLSKQPAQPTAGGKQSRVVRLLVEMFPTGVPSRADRPREPLRADLLGRDPSLAPLDLKTLKTAIEAYNRQVGNARNTNVSD